MVYDVRIDAYILKCEVTWIDEPGSPGLDTSDWDALGYRELEFRVLSCQWEDDQGRLIDAGRNACAELSDLYGEFIESDLWRQIDDQRTDLLDAAL